MRPCPPLNLTWQRANPFVRAVPILFMVYFSSLISREYPNNFYGLYRRVSRDPHEQHGIPTGKLKTIITPKNPGGFLIDQSVYMYM